MIILFAAFCDVVIGGGRAWNRERGMVDLKSVSFYRVGFDDF